VNDSWEGRQGGGGVLCALKGTSNFSRSVLKVITVSWG